VFCLEIELCNVLRRVWTKIRIWSSKHCRRSKTCYIIALLLWHSVDLLWKLIQN